MTAEQVNDLVENLTPIPITREQEAERWPRCQPSATRTADERSRSLRLPEELNRRLDEAATPRASRHQRSSEHAIESALAGRIKANWSASMMSSGRSDRFHRRSLNESGRR